MSSGIYEIRNMVNGHRYIGSARDLDKRHGVHLAYLRGNYHHNKHLQSAFNLYGEDNFIFTTLYECQPEELYRCEQEEIDLLRPEYNIRKKVESNYGLVTSDETKEKLRIASTGRTHTEETREKLRKASTGKHLSEEAKRKCGLSCKGIKQSPEWIEKRRLKRIGHVTSEETKQKISNSLKGNVPWNKGRRLHEQ